MNIYVNEYRMNMYEYKIIIKYECIYMNMNTYKMNIEYMIYEWMYECMNVCM